MCSVGMIYYQSKTYTIMIVWMVYHFFPHVLSFLHETTYCATICGECTVTESSTESELAVTSSLLYRRVKYHHTNSYCVIGMMCLTW